jgi:hypothetical protein
MRKNSASAICSMGSKGQAVAPDIFSSIVFFDLKLKNSDNQNNHDEVLVIPA